MTIPQPTGLRFYPASHRYRLDGKWVPGVTTLINKGLPKPALVKWSARTVAEYVADNPDSIHTLRAAGRAPLVAALAEIPWQSRDDAAVRGTTIHDYAHQLVNGQPVDVPEHLAGWVEACARFCDTWQFQPLVTERPCASREHWYAGTFDAIGTIRDGRTIILDWKTNRSGIFGETALQLVAYARAEFWQDDDGAEQPMPAVDDGFGVWLREDDYEVTPLDIGDRTHGTFLAVATVGKLAGTIKGLRGPAIYPAEVAQ